MRRVLLDFDFLGERLGLTADGTSHDVVMPDGSSRAFVPGAQVDGLPIRSAPLLESIGSSDQTMSVTLSVAQDAIWQARKAVPLQLVTCRVYWWPEDEVLRAEHELYRGVVRGPSWKLDGQGGGSLSFSLAPPRRTDDAPFPPTVVGDDGRFPDAPDDAKQFAVPVIYGTVKGLPLVAVSDITVDPVRLVVAGHRVQSTTIQIAKDGVDVGGLRTIFYDVDSRGGVYAYVLVDLFDYSEGLYATSVSGHVDGGKLVHRLGDVLEHAFRTYARSSWYELDRPRVMAAKAKLNRISIAAFANERDQTSVLNFIQQRLGGQFPIAFSAAGGRFGWDAIFFPRGGDSDFVVDRIIYGHDTFEREGPTETSADEVLSDIELTYGFDGYQAGDTNVIRFSRESSMDARRAYSRWGKANLLAMSTPDVGDESSAYIVLTDMVLKMTRVRTRVEYHGLNERFYGLPLASIIHVTDPDLGWTDEPCLLEAIEPRLDGLVDVVLLTLDGL